MIVGAIIAFAGILGFVLKPILFIAIIAGILIFLNGYSNGQRWKLGAQGEQLVAKHLTQLSPEYTNINDVDIPGLGGNIDHVVVGPSEFIQLKLKIIDHGTFLMKTAGITNQDKLPMLTPQNK